MLSWHRWREPLAVGLLVVSALMLAVRGLSLALAIEAGSTRLVTGLPGGDELLLLATALAVLWCATPVTADGDEPTRSPHARAIAVAGAVVVGVTVLGWLVLSIWSTVNVLTGPPADADLLLFVVDGLLRLAVPGVALLAVLAALRRVGDASVETDRPPLTATADEGADEAPAVTAAPERLPAAWQADEATGAVWLTADDAARGSPGLSWAEPTTPAAPGRADGGGAWEAPAAADEDDDLR